MLVEVRPVARLRSKNPVDVAAALGPVLDGLAAGDVDLSRVRIVCDWLQYKNNCAPDVSNAVTGSIADFADYRQWLADTWWTLGTCTPTPGTPHGSSARPTPTPAGPASSPAS